MNIIPLGATTRSIEINLMSNINWDRDFVTELVSEDCNILPTESCNPSFRITNNGNYQDQFLIEAIEIPTFVTIENGQKSLEIPKNSYIDINDVIITANEGVEAFSNSQVVFRIKLENSPNEYQNIAINVVIAPKIDWSYRT